MVLEIYQGIRSGFAHAVSISQDKQEDPQRDTLFTRPSQLSLQADPARKPLWFDDSFGKLEIDR